ncbi:hypothetical protein R3P38DRAFT_3273171 [Favolaschia claudopus]|uniref:Uncharacterized protein n=1 Tax=Favolaschia claudopus TaxID=2862362 RepID=A0AAW0B403_9AGAR
MSSPSTGLSDWSPRPGARETFKVVNDHPAVLGPFPPSIRPTHYAINPLPIPIPTHSDSDLPWCVSDDSNVLTLFCRRRLPASIDHTDDTCSFKLACPSSPTLQLRTNCSESSAILPLPHLPHPASLSLRNRFPGARHPYRSKYIRSLYPMSIYHNPTVCPSSSEFLTSELLVSFPSRLVSSGYPQSIHPSAASTRLQNFSTSAARPGPPESPRFSCASQSYHSSSSPAFILLAACPRSTVIVIVNAHHRPFPTPSSQNPHDTPRIMPDTQYTNITYLIARRLPSIFPPAGVQPDPREASLYPASTDILLAGQSTVIPSTIRPFPHALLAEPS